MSRVARIVVPRFPHPITQRGNRKRDVFETDDDRPCGSETFFDQLENLLGRTVRRKKIGRKPKKPPTEEQNQSENKEIAINA